MARTTHTTMSAAKPTMAGSHVSQSRRDIGRLSASEPNLISSVVLILRGHGDGTRRAGTSAVVTGSSLYWTARDPRYPLDVRVCSRVTVPLAALPYPAGAGP